jgi:hypothetical protein
MLQFNRKKYLKNILPLLIVFGFIACIGANSDSTKNESTTLEKDGFRIIFDGKTFTGWDADKSVWRIENGCFVGEVTPTKQIKTNSFLIWREEKPSDFEFIAEYKINEGGNSGINYRSHELSDIPYAVKGYQADIDGRNVYTGQNYEERGRGFLAMRGQKVSLEKDKKPTVIETISNDEELKSHIKKNDWNEIHLIVKGNHMQHFINGVLMSETTDNDPSSQQFSGVIGLQVHVSESMKVEYKNIRYKKLSK